LLETLLNNNNNNNNNNDKTLLLLLLFNEIPFFKALSNNEEPIKDNHKNKHGQNYLYKYKYHHVQDS
jgi:hypothetical protein